MNDNKISYTIQWTQPYLYCGTNYVLIDLTEAFEATVEEKLENGAFAEALDVINMIRNKQ